MRLDSASESLTSSTSAVTALKLSNISSTWFLTAIGRSLLSICSRSSLRSVGFTLIVPVLRSNFTRERRSFIILSSLSISLLISVRNSLYISTLASGWLSRESASTFIDVIGVLSSWDTLDTNSCLLPSSFLAFFNILLNELDTASSSV